MARLATIEEILAASETEIALPALSASLGEPRSVKVRKLSRAEFLLYLPSPPPGSDTWTPAEWAEREQRWLDGLSPEALAARRQTLADLNGRIVACCALAPTLTFEQAQRLGDDALVVAAEILRFSGLTAPWKTDEQTTEPAAA